MLVSRFLRWQRRNMVNGCPVRAGWTCWDATCTACGSSDRFDCLFDPLTGSVLRKDARPPA